MEPPAEAKKIRKKRSKKKSLIADAAVGEVVEKQPEARKKKSRKPRPVGEDGEAQPVRRRKKKPTVKDGETKVNGDGELKVAAKTRKKKRRPKAPVEGDTAAADEAERVAAEAAIVAEQKRVQEAAELAAKKKPSGLAFAEKIKAEQEAREAAREAERQAELARARSNFVESATEAQRLAKEAEEKRLAKELREREIAAHQEDVRRAEREGEGRGREVVERLQKSERQGKGAGRAWEEQNKAERETRESERAKERQLEIERAKEKYLDNLADSKLSVIEKERKWLEEQRRLHEIDDHMEQVREEQHVEVLTDDSVPDTRGYRLKYSDIRGKKKNYLYAEDYNMEHLEAYLDDAEFEELFQMPKIDFYKTPKWKREPLLKKLDLF